MKRGPVKGRSHNAQWFLITNLKLTRSTWDTLHLLESWSHPVSEAPAPSEIQEKNLNIRNCNISELWKASLRLFLSTKTGVCNLIYNRKRTSLIYKRSFLLLTLMRKTAKITIGVARERTSVQFSSVTQSCPTLCEPMDCSTPSFPVHHQYPKLAQTHVR